MRRRSRAGSASVKSRRRKAVTLKRRTAPKVRHRSSEAGQETEVARLSRELSEAREQQTATADVLKAISRSPTNIQPVFDMIAESARRLCEGQFCFVYRFDGQLLHFVAHHSLTPEVLEMNRRAYPAPPSRRSAAARAILERGFVQIPDIDADPDYVLGPMAVVGDYRSVVAVPILRDGLAIGSIAVARAQAGLLPDPQIELLKTFADQAAIAIENVRSFAAEQQRTRELAESLEQQTATSEVLRVISSSPSELEPVFHAMLEKATGLCEASFGTLFLLEGESFRRVARHNPPARYAEFTDKNPLIHCRQAGSLNRLVETKQPVHVTDMMVEEPETPVTKFGNARTLLTIPMLKDDELVGAIGIYRQEVRPFTDKQIALVQNFAAQAVIAIENARLLNELRQSLDRQTATSEVLSVISSSPGDLKPIFDTILENATRFCQASFGALHLVEGNAYRNAATYNVPAAYVEAREREPIVSMTGNSALARVAKTKSAVQIADVAIDPAYREDPHRQEFVTLTGARTLISVPMLKDDTLIGVITVYRLEVQPFTDKQIELVQNFAAQAVIAIENTRLLNELRQRTTDLGESLEQQTATSEVLRVISNSLSDIQPVFESIVRTGVTLFSEAAVSIALVDNDMVRAAAVAHRDLARAEAWRGIFPFPLTREYMHSRSILDRKMLDIPDVEHAPADLTLGAKNFLRSGYRAVTIVPLIRGDQAIGALSVIRVAPGPLSGKQLATLKTYADQAIIAIENTRLLNELRESLQRQTATSEVLSVISSSPANIQPVLEIIGERAERLCDAETSVVSIVDGDLIRLASIHGMTEAGVEAARRAFPMRFTDETVTARAVRTRSVCHVADVLSDPQYQQKDTARVSGYRGCLGVPMVRDEQVVGAIFVARRQPGLFSDAQVQLLKTFADQAVIAIENVRLFNETKTSLEQQTATADVLKIISRSAFDLRPVLQTLVESAARFCAADKAQIIREKNGGFYTAEAYGYSREFMDYIKNIPIKPERGTASGRALVEGRVVHIADVRADPEYTLVEASRLGDFRTALSVPMLREGSPVGVLTLTRSEVQPFTDKQIELVTTFADQAAIAIENVRLFDEIQDKSRQLEEASQHKSQFLANMSHELRTPLNAILGYAELMTDGAYGEPSEKMLGVLKRLEANGKHLLGLINDVLDLSKIEAGQLVLELSDYSVQDIAQTVRSTLEPLAADKKLGFKVEVAPDLPPGHGDGRRLTQVLINLVGNAIKFTDTGEVAIKAEAHNGSFHVSVRDTGPGISAADQSKLFQEFQQADNAITRKKGGTGLGLAISKRIIEMHGGRIWVESQSGQGSTFAFTLPVIVERQVEAA
jgi:GAF domain-containing protein